MAIDFPQSPILGATFDPGQGVEYTWDGSKWIANGNLSYVRIAGDTMVGNLNVPSLNDGQLGGFRNILINGMVNTPYEIRQRGSAVSNIAGDYNQYWADRWQLIGGGSMTQHIEEGNYVPGATYTLSGVGVSLQTATAPTTNIDWDISTTFNIPVSASMIQLEIGTVATPFEYRPRSVELALCERYYQLVEFINAADIGKYSLRTTMRANPNVVEPGGGLGGGYGTANKTMMNITSLPTGSTLIALDAEIT